MGYSPLILVGCLSDQEGHVFILDQVKIRSQGFLQAVKPSDRLAISSLEASKPGALKIWMILHIKYTYCGQCIDICLKVLIDCLKHSYSCVLVKQKNVLKQSINVLIDLHNKLTWDKRSETNQLMSDDMCFYSK